MSRRRALFWLVATACALPFALAFAGVSPIRPWEVLTSYFASSARGRVFWDIRVPRVLMGFASGGALAISGLVFQTVFRNPLATPFTLGVSSGAAFGAALAAKLGLGVAVWGVSGSTALSFLGALATIGLIFGVAERSGRDSGETMLLAGVAFSFCFSSAILLVQYLSDFTASFHVVRWLMGDLATVGYARPLQMGTLTLVCGAVVWLHAPDLNLVLAGEDIAASRGADVKRVRRTTLLAVSLLTGAVVSTCGPIGFVGMMVPYALRLAMGADHRYLVPASALAGGAFLALCDWVARTVVFPAEIPVGVLTSMLGGPFFLWVLFSGKPGR